MATNDGVGKEEELRDDGDMEIESQGYFDASSQLQGKGKGRLMEEEHEEEKLFLHLEEHEDERVFPLMELPTEIRLEIYRACLTRPYKISLSKVEQQHTRAIEPAAQENSQGDMDNSAGDEAQPAIAAFQQWRASRGLLPTNPRGTDLARVRRLVSNARPVARVTRSPRLARSSTASETSTVASSSNANVRSRRPVPHSESTSDTPTKGQDPLIVNILRVSKEVYKEARGVLYSENIFDLDISTAVTSLACLHQRSRRQIKHVELEIPTYTEILERFSEIVRLSLRYCSGMKKFVIHTPFTLPGADGSMSSSNTTVYANGFDILRWLPQQCEIVLKGNQNAEIDTVVNKHMNLAKIQDKVSVFAVAFSGK